jgi:hypothetical protein
MHAAHPYLGTIRRLYGLETETIKGFSTTSNREALRRTLLICDNRQGENLTTPEEIGEFVTIPPTPDCGHLYNGLTKYLLGGI